MAKKSTKPSRRARTQKEQASTKKKSTAKRQAVAKPAVMVASSDEPVKAEKKAAASKGAVSQKLETASSVGEALQPPRSRMSVNVAVLGVMIVALILGATIIRQQSGGKTGEVIKSGQASAQADEILQSGGKVCTNDQAVGDTNGSTNPQSVGMQLQTNPTNTIQTPQTFGGGSNDAMALQGAACF